MTLTILSILLQVKYKSGGEALLVGLLTGALILGGSYAIRAIRKFNQKEKDTKKIK